MADTDVSKASARKACGFESRSRHQTRASTSRRYRKHHASRQDSGYPTLVTQPRRETRLAHKQVSVVDVPSLVAYSARMSVVLLIVVPCIRERQWIGRFACPTRG
jgi:hypothetical protein